MEIISLKDKKVRENYIAFFDLDLTITGAISGKALAKAGFRKGLLSTGDLLGAIFLSLIFRFNIKDPYKIVEIMVRWVKGMPVNTMNDLCSEVLRKVLLPAVYKEAIKEIEFHKSKNARLVILSSALKPVCKEMAGNLKIDDIICSELEVKEGNLTGLPAGQLCFGEEKAIRLLDYCERNNYSPSECWYYGDSISDLPALSIVGHPNCVNPDKRLKKTALKLDWKILNWGN